MSKRSSKSNIWQHFIKGDGWGKCKHCLCHVKTAGNTTNLRNHMLRRHTNISIETESTLQKIHSKNESPGVGTDSQMHSMTRYLMPSTSTDCQQKQDVDDIMGMEDTQSISSHSQLSCNSACDNVQSENTVFRETQPLIDSCLSNIKMYEDGGGKAGKVTNSIIYMIAKDDLPLNTTAKEGFRNLMKTIAPLFKIPSRMTVTNMVDIKYDILRLKIMEKIKTINSISLTSDIWTDTLNTKSYLGLTGHFIDKDKLQSIVFGVTELEEKHSSEYLNTVFEKICSYWGIHSDVISAVVTDNAANIVKTVTDLYGKQKHFPCFAHTLNLVAAKPYDERDGISELKALLGSVKSIVKYFKHSVQASDQLRKAQEDVQVPLKLIQSVCTRWNSTYYQLERFIRLADKIAPILLMNSKAPPMLTAEQLDALKDIVKIYEPLEVLTKELSGQYYVTSSKIIPMVYCLKKSLESIFPNSKVGSNTKLMINNEIQKRFGRIEQITTLAISTLLDPRFKKMYFMDKVACSHAITRTTTMLTEIEKRTEELCIGDSAESITDVDNTNLWRFHNTLIKETFPGEERQMDNDLKNYLRQPVEDLQKCDPLKYWSDHKCTMYERISKLAPKYLCIVATSVPSERLFSVAGNICTPNRNRLCGERLHKLIFLKSLEKEYWGINE